MFQSLRNALSRFWRGFAARYPEEVLASEREELREEVQQARERFQEAATERARLEGVLHEGQAAAERLTLRVTDSLARGDREAAGEAALRLEELENDLAGKRTQMERAEATYRDARDRAVAAQEKFQRRAAEIDAERARLQASAAEAAQTDLAERLGAVDESVRRLERSESERAAAAKGAAMAAEDLARAEEAAAARRREERKQHAAKALARFTSTRRMDGTGMGGSAAGPVPEPPDSPRKTIGPAPG